MKFIGNLITLVIVLAAIAFSILFALQNTEAVPLDLLVYRFEPRSVALWVLGALVLGGILGLLASTYVLLRQRASLSSARRQLARVRSEMDKLSVAGPGSGG